MMTALENHKNVPPDWYERSFRENALQRFWHSRRIFAVRKLSEKISGELLDIGSADGFLTNEIFKVTEAKKIIGIDFLESSVKYAKEKYRDQSKLTFMVADAHNLPFETSQFDAVYCLEVLEHTQNPVAVLGEIHRVLKENGVVIILVPVETPLFRLIWALWTLGKGRVWKKTHINNINVEKLEQMTKALRFKKTEAHRFMLGMLLLLKARK